MQNSWKNAEKFRKNLESAQKVVKNSEESYKTVLRMSQQIHKKVLRKSVKS